MLDLCCWSSQENSTPLSNISSPQKSHLGQLISDQSMYCPYSAQCLNDRLIPLSDLGLYESSCCTSCSCNLYCYVTGNCCPDIIDNFILPLERIIEPDFKYKCIYPQMKEMSNIEIGNPSYLMISKCFQNYPNMDIKQKCENVHFIDTSSDVALLNPVESGVANALFRNKYCAQCNYIDDNKTEVWNPWLVCDETDNWMPSSTENLFEFIMENDKCNVLFRPLDNSNFSGDTCTYGLDVWASCNISGNWEEYNPYIDAACNAYSSYYFDMLDVKTYRNVFCYLCNVHEFFIPFNRCYSYGYDDPGLWHPGSFSALLNFNQETKLTSNEDIPRRECPEKFVFDIYEGRCRELYCSLPNVIRKTDCSPIYSTMVGIALEIFLKMHIKVPTENINQFAIQELIGRVETMRENLGLDSLCALMIYMGNSKNRYKTLSNGAEHNGGHQYYNFILIHVISTFTEKRDMKVLVEDIITFPYEHLSFMMDEYFTDAHLESNYYDLSQLDIAFQKNESLYGQKEGCLKLPIRITLQTNCVQVRLSANEFSFNEANNVCLINVAKCFTADEYTVSDNGTVLICSVIYLSKINTEIDYSENWVSLICTCLSVICLIFTFLTYCFFPELRTLPGKNNMALVASMTSAQLFFQFGLYGTGKITCVVLGICIHFLWLLTMFYMNVCCIHMLRVFIHTRRQSCSSTAHVRILISYSVYCIVMATIFVSANIGYSLAISDQKLIGYGGGLCYISTKKMVGFTFALPIGLVIIANIIMFFVVVYSIYNLPNVQNAIKHERNNLAIYMKLSTITGASWIFGFIYQWTGIIALAYTFTILNCCQGIFIMVSFVCNRRVKQLYVKMCSNRNSDKYSSSKQLSVLSTRISQSSSIVRDTTDQVSEETRT